GIRVGTDADMSPRRAITSFAYAYNSGKTDLWDGHNWGETYPNASTADIWDGHHWGDTYPTASNGLLWYGHSWGEVYPSSSNALNWAGHGWGEAYPTASNAELLDGLDGSQLLRSDIGGTINGSIALTGQNHINFYAGAVERIRYDAGTLSGSHGMLFLIHPTRRFIFGTSNDGSTYGSTLMMIPSKGAVRITEGLEVTGQVSAKTFQEISDSRLKSNIETLRGALQKLDQLRGVSFDWNDNSPDMRVSAGQRDIGVVAQEVEAVFPELVSTWGDEQYRTVDYGRLTAVLIEAIKELKQENANLRERIERIDGERSR
ncbi:MAG: tail fiber domain-containing protein, partial [bacterium]